ncbi:MAG: OmpA family protein, partial [Actinomycetota bacterium]
MAQATSDDELERGAAVGTGSGSGNRGGGVALADEGPDELPALLAFAVSIAILTIGLIWPTISGGSDDDHSSTVAAVEETAEEEETADEEPAEEPADEEEAAPALPDIPTIQGLLDGDVPGLAASADGNIVTLTGVVPDADTAAALVAMVEGQPNVESVVDQLEIAPSADAAVTATAAQVSIVLEGTVPDEATREAIVARAVSVYSEAQVDDQLVVDDSVGPPVSITLTGSMTDPVLFGQVEAAFADLDGVELADSSGFVLEESDELEAALNSLEPIQFASGSALVEPESQTILDDAAALLIENPSVALEIGGHTDSLGGEEANQTLSEARAQAVLDALVDR